MHIALRQHPFAAGRATPTRDPTRDALVTPPCRLQSTSTTQSEAVISRHSNCMNAVLGDATVSDRLVRAVRAKADCVSMSVAPAALVSLTHL